MVVRVFILHMFFLCIATSTLYSKIHYTGKEEVILLNTMETKHCFISYVKINGITYLLKQKKEYKKLLSVVRDALAAYIAQTLQGIAHEIAIIEAKKDFIGKVELFWPATLHTLAPGDTVRKQKGSKYSALRLKQWWAKAPSFAEQGLTKTIIEHITWHKQLPEILALDLFIGNSDRHCGNLCYDPTTDRFCAIDMDDTFNKDLCFLACRKLELMMQQDNVVFTKEELLALIRVKNTLKILVRKHTPYDMIQKLHFFANKAGFGLGGSMYDERISKKLLFFEKIIRESHINAQQLITLLDQITRHQAFSKIRSTGEAHDVV